MSVEGGTLELRQTREFATHERGDLIELWRELLWAGKASSWYRVVGAGWYGFAAFLALSVWMSIRRLWPDAPALSGQLAVAAIGFALSVALFQWMYKRFERAGYWRQPTTGDRYLITVDGFRQTRMGATLTFDWRSIEKLTCTDRYVGIICGDRSILFAKAAFADQDVEAFCSELQRRWHAARGRAA